MGKFGQAPLTADQQLLTISDVTSGASNEKERLQAHQQHTAASASSRYRDDDSEDAQEQCCLLALLGGWFCCLQAVVDQ